MSFHSEDALYFLREGEFEKAKTVYSGLLDRFPEDPNWICGFYVSSFWDNRVDHLLSLREGKERGKALLKYLEEFETEVSRRNFANQESTSAALHCILDETTHHLGLSYRLDGWNGMDPESWRGLALCYLRLRQFDKAWEVMEFGSGMGTGSMPSDLPFLKAECLLGMGQEPEAKEFYIRGFIEDPARLRKENVHWPVLKSLFFEEEKRIPKENTEDLIAHKIPIRLLRAGELDTDLPALDKEILGWNQILNQLNRSLPITQGKYRVKTELRLYFLAAILVRKADPERYPRELQVAKQTLTDLEAKINAALLP
jgi:tetratricopeptide (TPR) repeat protein